jgi:hypothetical protein
MKKGLAVVVVVLTVGLVAPPAGAVTHDDPDDVQIRLDLASVTLGCWDLGTQYPACEVGVLFHERVRVTPTRMPVTRFFLDAFGSSAPDFVMAFQYGSVTGTSHTLGCKLVRLSDRAVLTVSDVEESREGDSYYTQVFVPRRLTADTDWFVRAALRGDVYDVAPDTGRYHGVLYEPLSPEKVYGLGVRR